MSSVHHNRPHFSIEDAQEIARELYGLATTAVPLPSDRDQNFHLLTETGEGFVLKIASGAESADMLDLQNKVMVYLAGYESLFTPNICPTISGEQLTTVQDNAGTSYLVRMITFIQGQVLAKVRPHSPLLLHQIGRSLGRLDHTLFTFSHPAAHHLFNWDIRHAAITICRHLPEVGNPERRLLIERFLAEFETAVLPQLSQLRTQIIHNDANDYNFIISPSGQVSIIDFGDMVHSLTVADPAIAAAYLMLDKPDPLAALAHFLGGYYFAFPLTELEQALLNHFITIRLCTSVVMSAHQRRLEPDNDYLSISEKPAWELLGKLADIPISQIQQTIRTACTMPSPSGSKAKLLARRQKHLGLSLSVSYREPLKIVRGSGQFLYDETGRPYLDCVNNVCHVGHSHPRVVETASKQMAILNTNTRYLHDNIIHYAERLTATLPDPLTVCFFVNSGSEANDLALRLARAHTGQEDIIVLDGAYHGNLTSLIEISPYKFDGPGGRGEQAHVHTAVMPDGYRGPYKGYGLETGRQYAAHVQALIEQCQRQGRGLAAYIAESLLSCGGQIVFPDGYLQEALRLARAAGGVSIADEVQVGFGRVGAHFWGFETQGVIPDIVTMGKPIGNGHPLAAVVTTAEIARSFHNGMEYFNTFGGNPVSCAVGLAVLDVIEDEGLQQNALHVGEHLQAGLTALMAKHPLIGDVRGLGLFIGIELVRDRETLEPAAEEGTAVIERMKERGILLSTDGPLHNVIKIKPPLVFTEENADLLVAELDLVIAHL